MPAGRARPKHFPEGTLLSFVALGLNIVTTVSAVAFPNNLTARQVVYGLLLVFGFTFFASYLLIKHAFLACIWKVRPCCADDCPPKGLKVYCLRSCFSSWSMVHDLAFCIMALLYLLGDNLETACKELYCPAVARTVTGTSLVLNIFLTLLKVSGLKLNLPPAYPVIGTMGHVYDKMLGIAATTLTIDQTVTTILQSVDLRIAAGTTNDTIVQGNTLIVDNIREAQYVASGIMTFMCGIVILLVLTVLALLARANTKLCCDCNGENVKWYELVFQWLCGLLVMIFVVLFLVGNTDWVYDFFRPNTVAQPSTIVRLTALCASFAVLCILSLVYILGVCLPGACFALNEKEFFLPTHNDMEVDGIMMRGRYNEWGNKDSPPGVKCKHKSTECNLKGKIKVDDDFGKTHITLSIDELEKVKCCDPFQPWIDILKQYKNDTEPNAETHWSVNASIRKTDPPSNGEEAGDAPDSPSNGEGRGRESSPVDKNGIEMQPCGVDSSIRDTSGVEGIGGESSPVDKNGTENDVTIAHVELNADTSGAESEGREGSLQ